jgi:hypothetical protein
MKKPLSLAFLYLFVSFFLCGVQGSLYFLPLAMPFFWMIILTHYSFQRSLLFSILTNIPHALVITSFTSLSLSFLLIMMNLVSLTFFFFKDRFHINLWYKMSGAAAGTFTLLSTTWVVGVFNKGFYYPDIFSWTASSIFTFLFSPLLFLFFQRLEQRIELERVDMLANLRV